MRKYGGRRITCADKHLVLQVLLKHAQMEAEAPLLALLRVTWGLFAVASSPVNSARSQLSVDNLNNSLLFFQLACFNSTKGRKRYLRKYLTLSETRC